MDEQSEKLLNLLLKDLEKVKTMYSDLTKAYEEALNADYSEAPSEKITKALSMTHELSESTSKTGGLHLLVAMMIPVIAGAKKESNAA